MRSCLFIFTLSIALLNYVLGIPQTQKDFLRSGEDYSSGDQDKPLIPHSAKTKMLKRSLVAGDTFTPQEMLPIAEKLLSKVDDPGYGKGIVSSTKDPKELADKLFEAFFFNTKRIITLKDQDIIGIDALQALALEGEAADDTIKEDEVTEPAQKMYLRGQIVDINKPKPLRSHYKLVTKVIQQIPQGIQKNVSKGKRRGIPLSKKLPPKRHIVINEPQQRGRTQKMNNKYNKKNTKKLHINEHKKNRTSLLRKAPNQEKKKANCRWKYVCSTPNDLDTCRIHTNCRNVDTLTTSGQKHDDKNDMLIKEFRRMVGITAVDEEVEKILELRNIKLRPVNLEAIEKVESLAEFFNNIVVRENIKSTTSIPDEDLEKVSDPIEPHSDRS